MSETRTDRVGPILRIVRLAGASALLGIAACGGDDLLLPRDGEPARITAYSGNDQIATVGEALGEPLVVEVTDPAGRPVPGVEVVFVPRTAGAVLSPADRDTTDSRGHAAVSYTLSTAAGDQMVEARAAIVPESNGVTTFRVAARPGTAETVTLAGGNEQSAQVSTVLPESLAVKAVDHYGNGVAGIEVSWQTNGGGDVSPKTVVTGADGRAAVARTLGENPGSCGTVARAADLEGSPVSFTATAIAAPKPGLVLVTQPSSTAAAGVPFESQPELQLQDPAGAPLAQPDVSVTVQIARGGGSLGGRTIAKSDAAGRVKFTDLEFHGETGTHTLIFAADGFTPVTSSAIAVHPGPPSPEESSVSVPNGTAGSETVIAIRLKDEFQNNILGAAGDLAVAVTGANPTSALTVSDDGSGAYSASYVPVLVGGDAVTVQFRGAALFGPLASSVAPGPAAASTTTAEVTTTQNILYFTISIVVTVRDAQGNPVGHGGDRVEGSVDGGSVQPIPDNSDGTYSGSFSSFSASHTIVITLNGEPIQGSPFTTP